MSTTPDSRHYALVHQMNPKQKKLASLPTWKWPQWAQEEAKILAEWEASLPPKSNQWLETQHFLPEQGKHVIGCWPRKSGNLYRIICRMEGKWRIVGTGKIPTENPILFKLIEAPRP